MGILRISQQISKPWLAVSSLCLAIMAVTQSWAEEPVNETSSASPDLSPLELSESMEENAEVFSTGSLRKLDDGQLRFLLDVPGGNLLDGEGIESAEDQGDYVTFTIDLSLDGNESHIQSHNDKGSYGRLSIRRITASIHDLLSRPEQLTIHEWMGEDDIYTAMRLFMIYLDSQKSSGTPAEMERDVMIRDFLLQASHAVIIRRMNGDLNMVLYRQNGNDGSLLTMGEISVDQSMHYSLKGDISDPSYQARWKATVAELMDLQRQIHEGRGELSRTGNSDETTDGELIQKLQELEQQFSELYQEVSMPHELTWYVVTESVDYGAQSWFKMSDADNGSIHAAAQGVNYKVMSSLVETRAAEEIHRMKLDDLLAHVHTILGQVKNNRGRIEDENTHAYLSRHLATVWAAVSAHLRGNADRGYELPGLHISNTSLVVPVMRIRDTSHFVTSGHTLQDTLDQMTEALPAETDKTHPDKVIVSEHQYQQMKETLNRSGWIAWLKSFFSDNAYEVTAESSQLRELLSQNNASLGNLVTTGIEGGVPVWVIDPERRRGRFVFANHRVLSEYQEAAQRELTKDTPHYLVLKNNGGDLTVSSKALTDAKKRQISRAMVKSEAEKMGLLTLDQVSRNRPERSGTLQKFGHQAMGTLTAAGSGMATGYIVQRGVDAAHKYYNEGLPPWRISARESDAQHERAIKQGSVMAANAAVSHLVLPHVATSHGYFENLSGKALRNRALKGKYEASVAGGIAGAVTQSAMAGYQYWNGNISAGELATDIADATGRSLFTTAGSIGGHALIPYSFDVPYISSLLPIGNVGAVMGSVAGNVAYDTVKHYTRAGVQGISNYYNGMSDNTVK